MGGLPRYPGQGAASRRVPFEFLRANAAGITVATAWVWCVLLFAVADQRIAQTVLEGAEPGLVVPPLQQPLTEDRLADLL